MEIVNDNFTEHPQNHLKWSISDRMRLSLSETNKVLKYYFPNTKFVYRIIMQIIIQIIY